jgi:hypothetical protein
LIKDNPELADELEVKIKARIKNWLLKQKELAKAFFFFLFASFFDVFFRNLVIENKLYHVLLP